MKHLYLFLALFLSSWSFAQEKEQPKVERAPSALQGEVVPTEKRTTTTVKTSSDPNGQTRYYVLSRETMVTEEITKESKMAQLDEKIQSVEGKLFLLNEDPIANEVEIAEKLQYLKELQAEKETLKNL